MPSPVNQPLALDHPIRMASALFFMALGFSILSVCLFRVLAFTPASVAFFVLYLCAGMPVGGLLAQWKSPGHWKAVERSMAGLAVLALFFPILGWLCAHSPDPMVANLYGLGPAGGFWKIIAWQALVTSPLFILWGYAEYAGYAAAIDAPQIRRWFYLIFIWALACAYGVAYYAIPCLGWLRTLLLAPVSAALAYGFWAIPAKSWLRRSLPVVLILAVYWALAGMGERHFQFLLFSDKPFHALSPKGGDSQALGHPPIPLGKNNVVASLWGRFCHVSLLRHDEMGGLVAGCYDGIIHWLAHPDHFPPHSLESAAFELIPENGDVCILGAGGGVDVLWALRRGSKYIAAVDIVPEVFALLRGGQSWANAGIYNHPAVETVCAEGRKYLETSGRKFDVIALPHTESQAAAAKALFEPGQRIHTVEGFSALKAGLNPGGKLIVMKSLDREGKLFNGYAASLIQAGYGVSGVLAPAHCGLEGFVLVASAGPQAPELPPNMLEIAHNHGAKVVYFEKTPPGAAPITDDSPWIQGVLGSAFPRHILLMNFAGLALLGLAGAAASLAYSLKRRPSGQTIRFRCFLTLAGVMIGANAILLENAVIFWFVRNLINPLSAFVIGTCVFLMAWSLSSLALGRKSLIAALAAAGLLSALALGAGGAPTLGGLGLMALGGGLAFPLLVLRHPEALVHLFLADMLGGLLGGLLGIWAPVLAGMGVFNSILPWAWAGAMTFTALAVHAGSRPGQGGTLFHPR